ncbi:chloride channel CLIC 1 [Pelobates cultripes]|uniref:Chloride channel CLIC-like protein 1 n=1 Tax=Pelobates cultripes TaxID=61616 RepID=A0AAD1SU85_PELCU|nr:chloride channel CLIC 1 [Pelobates cultripes]
MEIQVVYVTLLLSSCLWIANSNKYEEDFVDPTDMVNYDAVTKTMRKKTESTESILKKLLQDILDEIHQLGPLGDNQEQDRLNMQELPEMSRFLEDKEWDPLPLKMDIKNVLFLLKHHIDNNWEKRSEYILQLVLENAFKFGDDLEESHLKAKDLLKASLTEIIKCLKVKVWNPGELEKDLKNILLKIKKHEDQIWNKTCKYSFYMDFENIVMVVVILIMLLLITLWKLLSTFAILSCVITFIIDTCLSCWIPAYKAFHIVTIIKMDLEQEDLQLSLMKHFAVLIAMMFSLYFVLHWLRRENPDAEENEDCVQRIQREPGPDDHELNHREPMPVLHEQFSNGNNASSNSLEHAPEKPFPLSQQESDPRNYVPFQNTQSYGHASNSEITVQEISSSEMDPGDQMECNLADVSSFGACADVQEDQTPADQNVFWKDLNNKTPIQRASYLRSALGAEQEILISSSNMDPGDHNICDDSRFPACVGVKEGNVPADRNVYWTNIITETPAEEGDVLGLRRTSGTNLNISEIDPAHQLECNQASCSNALFAQIQEIQEDYAPSSLREYNVSVDPSAQSFLFLNSPEDIYSGFDMCYSGTSSIEVIEESLRSRNVDMSNEDNEVAEPNVLRT